MHLDVASFLLSPDSPERSISSYDVEKAEISRSSASSSVVMLRTTLLYESDSSKLWEGQDTSRLSEI